MKIKKSILLPSLTVIALLISVNTHAKIYKWTDANGQVHYSAQPPTQKQKKIKAENIEDEIKSRAGKYRPPSKKISTESNTNVSDETKNENESNSDSELAGPSKQLISYCKNQRTNLEQLKKNFRNVWIDTKGKKTALNQEQRQAKVARIQQQINEDCADVQTKG